MASARTADRPRRRPAGDLGQATLEQLGVVVVAALLALGGVAGVATYGPHLNNALCQLGQAIGFAGACADVPQTPIADGPTDEDFRPPVCTLRTDSDQASSSVKIGFVTIGEDNGFIVTQNSDGTVTATATNGGSLGGEVGFGASIGGGSKGDLGLGADVSFGAGVKAKAGDTWKFDSMEEWESMREQLDDYLIQEMQLQSEGGAGIALWKWISDSWVEKPRDPDVTSSSFTVEVTVDGQAGLRLGDGTTGKNGKPGMDNLNRGAYIEGKVGGTYVRTTDHKSGNQSSTYQFDASGGGGLNWGFGNAGGGGEYQSAFKITRDKNDKIVSVEFLQETSASWSAELDLDSSIVPAGQSANGSVKIGATEESQRTVVTTELDVTDANRGVVESWLAQSGLGSDGLVLMPSNAFEPSKPVADDPFANLLYQEGRNSVQVYDQVDDGFSFGAEFAVGLKIGASFSSSSTTSTINSAIFLGAPGADGTRGYVNDAVCSLD